MRLLYCIYWALTWILYGTRLKVGKNAKFRVGGRLSMEKPYVSEITFLLAKTSCLQRTH